MSSESIQEYMKLVNEINQGMEQVKRLRASSSGSPNQEATLERMVASYTEAALILNGGASQGQAEVMCSGVGIPDDGYIWREYGRKEILGCKYPRHYFRCQHWNTRCLARKHAQQLDEDPRKWMIVYHMKHTCIKEASKVPVFD